MAEGGAAAQTIFRHPGGAPHGTAIGSVGYRTRRRDSRREGREQHGEQAGGDATSESRHCGGAKASDSNGRRAQTS